MFKLFSIDMLSENPNYRPGLDPVPFVYLCLTNIYDISNSFPFLSNCGNVAFGVNERSRYAFFCAVKKTHRS